MFKLTATIVALSVLAACGSPLDTGSKQKKERRERVETQRRLIASERRESQLKAMLATATPTPGLLWVWRSAIGGEGFDRARQACKDNGFDLPTAAQREEALKNERIKGSITFAGDDVNVFVLDRPELKAYTILCVKPRALEPCRFRPS